MRATRTETRVIAIEVSEGGGLTYTRPEIRVEFTLIDGDVTLRNLTYSELRDAINQDRARKAREDREQAA